MSMRAAMPALLAVAALGAAADHGVLPMPRIALVQQASQLRDTMTARAICQRRAAVALLGDAPLTEESVEAFQRDCETAAR